MSGRILFLLFSTLAAISSGHFASGEAFAASLGNAGVSLALPASAVTKVQTACGWTYSCTNLGGGNGPQNIQIFGPVNVYPGTEAKAEVWKVPDGAWAWTGNQTDQSGWRGWGCSGHMCDDKCGAFCWFNRIRAGYCGHGCNAYREHVMFQPVNGNLRPYVYNSGGDSGYGDGGGYNNSGGGYGESGWGYGSGRGYYGSVGRGGYGRASWGQQGYPQQYGGGDYYRNARQAPPYGGRYPAPQDAGATAPGGERFVDRLRRYFVGGQAPQGPAANGPVRFERPNHEIVPLRRFDGPKYPPSCTGKAC